jgi:LAO/AO transport system kinase
MEEHHADRGVWVRSLATRGAAGGLAGATLDAARVLDAAGFEIVVVETIGVGQDEVEVARAVETVVLVEAPNLGDDVQALKAGLLEIADLIVVGKADLPGADRALATLRAMFHLAPGQPPPLLKASAATGRGIAPLADAVDAHLAWLSADGRREQRAQARAHAELERLLREELVRVALARLGAPNLDHASALVASRKQDPYLVARGLIERVLSAAASPRARRNSAGSTSRTPRS